MASRKRKGGTSVPPAPSKKPRTSRSASDKCTTSVTAESRTRSQKAKEREDAVREEDPSDPNNPDEPDDGSGGGGAGSPGGGGELLRLVWQPRCRTETFSQVSHRGLTRVASVRINSDFSEAQPLLISIIQQRREILLHSYAIDRAIQVSKPVAVLMSLAQDLASKVSISEELLYGNTDIHDHLAGYEQHPRQTIAALATSIFTQWTTEVANQVATGKHAVLGRLDGVKAVLAFAEVASKTSVKFCAAEEILGTQVPLVGVILYRISPIVMDT